MTDLSPAAQAVMRAYREDLMDTTCGRLAGSAVAAALQAAADQVVPEEPPFPPANSPEARKYGTPDEWMYEGIEHDARGKIRAQLLAMAAELKTQ